MLQAQQNHHDYDDFARAIQDKPPIHDAVSSRDFEDFLSSKYFLQADLQQRQEDLEAMREVTLRIREQVRSIIRSLRGWQASHTSFHNTTRLRYSAYEGALCYSDLRRHWAYYRHAMRELSEW
ncbi:MAG: hypothetical protein GW778_01100 [Alphaproteobacteria bacterium]|nr:hypothetical protein [Alphaproteobacteria bacterium]